MGILASGRPTNRDSSVACQIGLGDFESRSGGIWTCDTAQGLSFDPDCRQYVGVLYHRAKSLLEGLTFIALGGSVNETRWLRDRDKDDCP